MTWRLLLLHFFCLAIAFPVLAQVAHMDSLKAVAQRMDDGKPKVDLLNEISLSWYDYSNEQGFLYASQAYDIAEKIGYNDGRRYALTLESFNGYSNGDFAQALDFLNESQSIAKSEDDLLAYNFSIKGKVFQALARYDSAEANLKKAISIELATKSSAHLGYCYKNLGRLYVLLWRNEEARLFFHKSLEVYNSDKNKRGLPEVYYSLADVSRNLGYFDSANYFVERACSASHEFKDKTLILTCLINQGEIRYNSGEYIQALKDYFDAIEISEQMELPVLLARLYQDLGDVYDALGQTEVALKYYLESLKVAERLGIKYEIAKGQSGASWIYKNQHNFPLAKEYIGKALKLREEIGDVHGISYCYNIMGLIFLEQKKYDSSLFYLEKSLTIRKRINHKTGISACLFNKALVLEEQNKLEEALSLQLAALAIDTVVNSRFTAGISYNAIGNLYTKLRKFEKASEYLKIAGEIARATGSRSLKMNNFYYWSAYYEKTGDYKTSLSFHQKYADLNDSIYYEAGAGKLAELQALYQVEQKDQEIKLLSKEKEIQQKELSLQRSRINLQTIIIVSVVVGLFLVSLLAFKSYQYNKSFERSNRAILEQKEEIQAQSEELIEANSTIANINMELETKIELRTQALTQAYKELDTFFYRASHDFRRPLTTFMGLAEVASITVKDNNALELFDKVKITAVNLDKMLVKLQSISDVGAQEIVYKEVMLREIFENVCNDFRDELQRKNIKAGFESKISGPFVSYPAMVKTIIENLIENAIHFCGVDHPYVKVIATESGRYVTLEVQDNGQGIQAEYQDRVFEMYFRGSERSKGNGLGLYIVQKAVQKLEGSITMSSIYEKGTTFTVMLPNRMLSGRIIQ
jgi:signal transduction histidine kinase